MHNIIIIVEVLHICGLLCCIIYINKYLIASKIYKSVLCTQEVLSKLGRLNECISFSYINTIRNTQRKCFISILVL